MACCNSVKIWRARIWSVSWHLQDIRSMLSSSHSSNSRPSSTLQHCRTERGAGQQKHHSDNGNHSRTSERILTAAKSTPDSRLQKPASCPAATTGSAGGSLRVDGQIHRISIGRNIWRQTDAVVEHESIGGRRNQRTHVPPGHRAWTRPAYQNRDSCRCFQERS